MHAAFFHRLAAVAALAMHVVAAAAAAAPQPAAPCAPMVPPPKRVLKRVWVDTDGGLDDMLALDMLAHDPNVSVGVGAATAVSGITRDPAHTLVLARRVFATATATAAKPEDPASSLLPSVLEPMPEFGAGAVASAFEPPPVWLQAQRAKLGRVATLVVSASASASANANAAHVANGATTPPGAAAAAAAATVSSPSPPTSCAAAVRYLSELKAAGEECSLLALGPLTNVAAVLAEHGPLFFATVSEVVVMGGAVEAPGNYDGAEFNFRGDPASTAAVLAALGGDHADHQRPRLTLVPLDVCEPPGAANGLGGWAENELDLGGGKRMRDWMEDLVRAAAGGKRREVATAATEEEEEEKEEEGASFGTGELLLRGGGGKEIWGGAGRGQREREDSGGGGSDGRDSACWLFGAHPAAACVLLDDDYAGLGCVNYDPVAAHFLTHPTDFDVETFTGVQVDARNGALKLRKTGNPQLPCGGKSGGGPRTVGGACEERRGRASAVAAVGGVEEAGVEADFAASSSELVTVRAAVRFPGRGRYLSAVHTHLVRGHPVARQRPGGARAEQRQPRQAPPS